MLFAKRQRERQLEDTVYEIRGNAGGGLGDGGRAAEDQAAQTGWDYILKVKLRNLIKLKY